MKIPAFKPGRIWIGMELTAASLESQWTRELRHRDHNVDFSRLAFSESDWTDLDWNAREVIHLNGAKPKFPLLIRNFIIPQDRVNIHLIRAFQKLLGAWQQWIHLPHVKTIASLPPAGECGFLLSQAWGRLEGAQARYESLVSDNRWLHQFSLRQWRLLQQLGAVFSDLDPLVTGAAAYARREADSGETAARLETDITWHSREILILAGRPEYRPDLLRRIRAPRLEINRMLAANCLFQSTFLKALLKI